MAIDYSIVGERIKKARLSKHLTQEALAEHLNLSVAFISRVETGKSHFNLKRLEQVADFLGVSEGELLNGSSNHSQAYLDKEFSDLLKQCSSEKQKLIYEIAKAIAKTKNEF